MNRRWEIVFCVRLDETFTSIGLGHRKYGQVLRQTICSWIVKDIFVHKLNIIAFIILVVLYSSVETKAQRIRAVRDPDSARLLTIKKAGDDLPTGDLAEKVQTDGAGNSTLKMSADKRYEVSVFCIPSGSKEVPNCVARVFILDLQTDENYEIVGEELGTEAGRPVDEIKWINSHTLSYERWTGPHFGHRYIVDVKAMKQVDAFMLTDR